VCSFLAAASLQLFNFASQLDMALPWILEQNINDFQIVSTNAAPGMALASRKGGTVGPSQQKGYHRGN
jgi:hypothetical protein